MPLTRAQGWKIALGFPGVEERLWFNQPSVFLHNRFLTKVHDKEEAMTLMVASIEMRDVMLEADPKLFYITDHYKNYPMILARLKVLDSKMLKEILVARAAQLAAMPPIKRKKKPKKKKS